MNPTKYLNSSSQKGSAVKVVLGLVAVAVVGTAGFLVYAKGRPLSENPLAQITKAVQPVPSEAKPETQKSAPVPGASPEAAPSAGVQDMPPSTSTTVAAAATPKPLRVAPAGMVFLTKRVTVSRETGVSSYAEGTLVLVKSKAGGKIKGSINGVTIEVPAANTATTFQ